MRILIVGAPKTGTTALMDSIAGSLGFKWEFEKTDCGSDNLVRKILFHQFADRMIDEFDRIIFTCRDPRDRLISAFVYFLAFGPANMKGPFIALDLLQRKEFERELPFHILLREASRHCFFHYSFSEFVDRDSLAMIRRHRDNPKVCVFHYHDLIKTNFETVSELIGKKIKPFSGHWSPIAYRAGGCEYWRRWFTESDLDYFTDIANDWARTFGFGLDWRLSDEGANAAEGSEWFKIGANKWRKINGVPELEF